MGLRRREAASIATLVAWSSTFLLIPALHALDHHEDDHIHLPGGGIVHVAAHHHHDEAPAEPSNEPELDHLPASELPAAFAFTFILGHGGGAAHFAAAALAPSIGDSASDRPFLTPARDAFDHGARPRALTTRSVSARGPPVVS